MLKSTLVCAIILAALAVGATAVHKKKVIVIIVRRRPRDVQSQLGAGDEVIRIPADSDHEIHYADEVQEELIEDKEHEQVSEHERAPRAVSDEPLWLYRGDDVPRAPSSADHPTLPNIIDDVRFDSSSRHARSLPKPRPLTWPKLHSPTFPRPSPTFPRPPPTFQDPLLRPNKSLTMYA